MTNTDKAIEVLMEAMALIPDGSPSRKWSPWTHIEQALAILREKPEPSELSRLLRQSGALKVDAGQMFNAADLIDQQAQEIDRLTHLVADLKGEASKAQEAINEVELPDPPTMSIFPPPGTKVVFAYPNAGYEAIRFLARRYLTVGQTYTVERTEISQTSTRVYLKEVTGQSFNSVLFAPAINQKEQG